MSVTLDILAFLEKNTQKCVVITDLCTVELLIASRRIVNFILCEGMC